MPQIRYFHRGRYFRPSKPLHFLPPLKLTTGATQHPTTSDDRASQKTTTTRGRGRDRKHSRYRKMVMTLASYLTLANVADMKFLCRDHVRPPQIVDEVTSARHLFALLENQRLLAENSLYFLQTLLYYIARPDLYQIVLEFRADRQDHYKERGVDIVDKYQVNLEDDAKRLELASELLKFRKDLKPRRRFNQVDVSEMRRKLEELSAKMQDNINTMQRPNSPKHAQVEVPDEDSLKPKEDIKPDTQNSDTKMGSRSKSIPLKPVVTHKKLGKSSQHQPQHKSKSPVTETVRKRSISNTARQQNKAEADESAKLVNGTSLSINEWTEPEMSTDDEVVNSDHNFGYETPCPPPRELVLGISGVKVYDDVSISSIKPYGATTHSTSTLPDQVTNKIHRLRRLSNEQRRNPRGRVQRKKKKSKPKVARSSDQEPATSCDEEKRAHDKDELKLPDIYDKYARQTAVQYYS